MDRSISFCSLYDHRTAKGWPKDRHLEWSTDVLSRFSFDLVVNHPPECRGPLYGLAYQIHGRIVALKHYPLEDIYGHSWERGSSPHRCETRLNLLNPMPEAQPDLLEHLERDLDEIERLVHTLMANEHAHSLTTRHTFKVSEVWPVAVRATQTV